MRIGPVLGIADPAPLHAGALPEELVMGEHLRALLRRPIVVAPMGGGPSTPGLVAAAAEGGALGLLAAAYKTAEEMKAEIDAVRSVTPEPFGVNVFVPGTPTAHPSETTRYVESPCDEAAAVGAVLATPGWDDDDWTSKVNVLIADPPPLVSFTFGCPSRELVEAFRDAGSVVAVTVTNPDEAQLVTAAGADCLCVQGIEAGAHRRTFTNDDRTTQGSELLELIAEVAQVTDRPQIAAGGIMNPESVAAVLRAGAVAAQCGTAFLSRLSCGVSS
jgi:nitronate monooxygenase